MSGPADLRIVAVPGFPLVEAGTDLVAALLQCLDGSLGLEDGDVIAFAQKIVSKSEGRHVDLSTVAPTSAALELSAVVQKDPRLVELVLRESRRIVRAAKDVLIVEHRLGFIMANAGIDQSNVSGSSESALLLPEDPDRSAHVLREELQRRSGRAVAVLVTDSFGRPWRIGTTGVAIGAAGIASVLDLRGTPDMFGRTLRVSVVGHADEIAAAASLVMGQGAQRRPVVIVRGLAATGVHTPAKSLLRPSGEDLFR